MISFKNLELLSYDDIETFTDESFKIVKNKSLSSNKIEIEISKRCKRVAGNIKIQRNHYKIYSSNLNVKINVSYDYYKEFGIDRIIKTLRHEFAHLIAYTIIGRCDHGNVFKTECAELGGTMNSTLAGTIYSECASAEYIKKVYKWKYTCPGCGHVTEKVRKFSEKTKDRYICLTCRTKVRFFKEEAI